MNASDHAGDDARVVVGELADGFYVEGDGPGIPTAERERGFAPGYPSTDGGTGVAPDIVKRVVSDHGWTIRASGDAN